MSPPTATSGLSGADVEVIRAALDAGRKPKVEFTPEAGQIAGKFGQVIDLLDPSADEWIVVRFGRDELPFSPADLAIPPKGQAKRAVKKAEPEPPSEPEPSYPTYEELAAPTRPARKAASRQEAPMPAANDQPVPTQGGGGAPKARRAPKPKPLPSLTVTVAYTEGEWTVAAQQGSKALARPYMIKAAEALQLVGMLDVPGVAEAVAQIIEAERAQAQAQAERLRNELAEVEARLADFPNTR